MWGDYDKWGEIEFSADTVFLQVINTGTQIISNWADASWWKWDKGSTLIFLEMVGISRCCVEWF